MEENKDDRAREPGIRAKAGVFENEGPKMSHGWGNGPEAKWGAGRFLRKRVA